jgi:hypothetical protein
MTHKQAAPIECGDKVFETVEAEGGFVHDFIREQISSLLGWSVCGSIGWDEENNPLICIQRYGVEHTHS